jgi:SNF2 family DNA or RNA helicase
LIFSQFVAALSRFRDASASLAVPSFYLDGSTTDRASVIKAFQQADGAALFFVSLRAGGTGINLTAADYVFICDPWWNPQVERQAVDRAHRIGRTGPVVVTRIVAANTIEEKVLELQDQKRRLAEELIEENADRLPFDDPEQLLALFAR